jgi:hypothetical protein
VRARALRSSAVRSRGRRAVRAEGPAQKGPSCSSSPALPLRAAAKTDRLSFSSAANRFPLSQKTGSEIRGNASRGGLGLAAVKVVLGCPHPPISNFSHACAEGTGWFRRKVLAEGQDRPYRSGPRLSLTRSTTAIRSEIVGRNTRRRTMVAPNSDELLAMFCVIEAAKDAVEKFENGEINVREAIRLLREATVHLRAA